MTSNNKKIDSRHITHEHLDKIGEVAVYYGFTPAKSPSVSKEDISLTKDILDGDYIDDETVRHGKLPLHAEEKIAIIRHYEEQDMFSLPQPVMFYFKDAGKGTIRKSSYPRYADLEILGPSGSIAEATLIQAARAMLAEEGYIQTEVEINSIGDRDSIARFTRELTAYYRKNIDEMTPECRQLFKQDPFELLASKIDSAVELNTIAPKSMDFLSEPSRKHLEEVLEYLEALKIPYTINNTLIGNKKYCTETVFAIVNRDETVATKKLSDRHILAVGVRYNGLAKRLGMKKDVAGVGISLLVDGSANGLRKPVTKFKRPIASFVQLGLESKLMSLEVIEKLRQVKIPLYLSLAKDRLGAQVSNVEKYHTPYVIVMGKKEAVDRTAIVRETETHCQNIISIEELPAYMKKMESEHYKK
ncbi:MAG: His/Gly/Thr/Pro-type tRNA ligase C-terminal domain-containing protein [Candidatus Taylorbacteria bacterium]